jgi:hypothetical protein
MAAAALLPGHARAALDSRGALDLTEEERQARAATTVRVWQGRDRDSSYIATWTWRGRTVWESWQYIYDWDQPTVFVGPAELVERAAVAQSIVSLGYAVQGVACRMEREAKAAADEAAKLAKRLPGDDAELARTFGIEVDEKRVA